MAPINTTPAPFTIQLPALPPQALPPAGAVLIYFDQVSGKLKAIDSTGTSVLVGIAGAAGGASTEVQFNDGGALDGDAGLTYDKTTKSLTTNGGANTDTFLSAGSTGNNFIEVSGDGVGHDNDIILAAEEAGGVVLISANTDITLTSGVTTGDITLEAGVNLLNSIEVSGNAGDNGIFANAKETGAVLNLEADQDVSITSDHAHVDISSGTGISITPGTLLSFFGAAGSTKPTVTGAKGGNAALTSLLTALANLGLITNSTT